MENHSIILSGITITEPGTCFTDVVLCILCFILYKQIQKNFTQSHFIDAWKYFFLFMSFSTGIGVLVHGFSTYFPALLLNYSWMAMNISVAIASYFTLRATSKFVARHVKERKKINIFNTILLCIFILLTLFMNNFEIVKIFVGFAVTVNFLAHLIGHIKDDEPSRYIMLGMFISFLTIFIHSTQVIYNAWVDYKSISHVIMMLSILLVYKGVRLSNKQLEMVFN